MSKADQLRAELALEELQEEFLTAKAAFEAGDMSHEDYREVKQRFHDARVAHREARDARATATVEPATVEQVARPTDEGGHR